MTTFIVRFVSRETELLFALARLVPATHAFLFLLTKTWMAE
jgi:hypothetical protein